MITNKDISVLNLSPTAKDFYQIWNELLDTAKNLSERWDPTSTNESDPGIVLLKVLTAIADKLNYNIDKNILEAFMPSAAQEESMRKLCEMMGYNVKYYQSAMTDIIFSYVGDSDKWDNNMAQGQQYLEIPQFMNITNNDKDVNYVAIVDDATDLNHSSIVGKNTTITVRCLEGQAVQCESDNDNIISIDQLDDNHRYYLPEHQIAENGIFVYTIENGVEDKANKWLKVENLNTTMPGQKVYKFGYDSKEARPYIQFPDDVSQIIGDGLSIWYVRTSGINGNISPKILTTFEIPTTGGWENFDATDFALTNENAATNGRNIETISQAYEGFKKTVGTFDTLVTCRDYMNKIYQLVDDNNYPLVSNSIVSDIRDDINRAQTVCSFNDYGICYVEEVSKAAVDAGGFTSFDLMIYTFKTILDSNSIKEYKESFTLDNYKINEISAALHDYKTLSHNFRYSENDDEIACIKNYLRLNATITTISKVNIAEQEVILTNIKKALFNSFNMRRLDFGEEIPFDSILECIENADARIKNVALDEPILYTKFLTCKGTEYDIASKSTDNQKKFKKIYNRLAVRNILAGRIQLFNYNTEFKAELNETEYKKKDETTPVYDIILPNDDTKKIKSLDPKCDIPWPTDSSTSQTLNAGEVIKFRKRNYKTTVTYPAYVNYFLHLENNVDKDPQPATFIGLASLLGESYPGGQTTNIIKFINDYASSEFHSVGPSDFKNLDEAIKTDDAITGAAMKYGFVFETTELPIEDISKLKIAELPYNENKHYYYLQLTPTIFTALSSFIATSAINTNSYYNKPNPITRILNTSLQNTPGEMIDSAGTKYQFINGISSNSLLTGYYVQDISRGENNNYGKGIGGEYREITSGTDYQLKAGEYLLINYTPASQQTTDGSTTNTTPVNLVYGKDTVIRLSGFNAGIVDSDVWHSQGHTWVKTSGFDFNGKELWDAGVPAGMFAFGPNEKAEIREKVQVTLDSPDTYLYCILNEPISNNTKRILEDGEYIFYTTDAKLSLAYYGSGTEIENKSGKALGENIDESSIVPVEDIFEKGIKAVPWEKFNLNGENVIYITEYEYFTLTAGDTLVSLEHNDQTTAASASSTADANTINSTWARCKNVWYKLAGSDTSTPLQDVNFTELDSGWWVRSYLALDVGPNKTQTLYAERDQITVCYEEGEPKPITPVKDSDNTTVMPLSIKTNYTVQAVCDSYPTIWEVDDPTTGEKIRVDNFKLKIFKQEDIEAKTGALALHNFGLGGTWTKINADDIGDDGIKLYTAIRPNEYGLIMVYVVGAAGSASIESNQDLKLFNSYANAPESSTECSINNMIFEGWDSTGHKGTLKIGLNIVVLPTNTSYISIKKSNELKSIIISDLDIVNCNENEGLNIDLLNYYDTLNSSSSTAANQLLYDLWLATANTAGDPTKHAAFYYNCPMENSSAIHINPLAIDSNNPGTPENPNYEKLSSAYIWYDYNNRNNKFVISEIDADYLTTGIQIARTSKR